ncbi:MAG: ZIP family metal transporter [Candidatus ainarchaeum sp.]|nr:ZIP family metal transporter [Candidatus ainarchaeum sp.]
MLLEIILATVVVSLISLVGVVLISLKKEILDTLVFMILSFATGSLLAAAFFDLFPEAIDKMESGTVFTFALAGMMAFFIMERLVHWHHEHHDHHVHEKPIGYLVLIGDGVHNFFDGVAIAASFMTAPQIGIATTLAIILHEIPQELSDFSLLLYAGFSKTKALLFNLLSALTAIAGALGFYFLAGYVNNLEAYGLAFTAGGFLYIAGTDLLPELHKEEQTVKSVMQLAMMFFGILLMWFLINHLGG